MQGEPGGIRRRRLAMQGDGHVIPDFFRSAAPRLAMEVASSRDHAYCQQAELSLAAPRLCLLADRLLAVLLLEGSAQRLLRFAKAVAEGNSAEAANLLKEWCRRCLASAGGFGRAIAEHSDWVVEEPATDRVAVQLLQFLATYELPLRARTRGLLLRRPVLADAGVVALGVRSVDTGLLPSGRLSYLRQFDSWMADMTGDSAPRIGILEGAAGYGTSFLLDAWANDLGRKAGVLDFAKSGQAHEAWAWLPGCLRLPDPTGQPHDPPDMALFAQIRALVMEPPEWPVALEPSMRRNALARALAELIAERGPLTIVLDTQHLDRKVLDTLPHYLPELVRPGVVLVLAGRPGAALAGLESLLPQDRVVGRIYLGPLGVQDFGEVLGIDDRETLIRLHRESGGWPLCLEGIRAQIDARMPVRDLTCNLPTSLLVQLAKPWTSLDFQPIAEFLALWQPYGFLQASLLSAWWTYRTGRSLPASLQNGWWSATQGQVSRDGEGYHLEHTALARFLLDGAGGASRREGLVRAFVSWIVGNPEVFGLLGAQLPQFLADQARDLRMADALFPLYVSLFRWAVTSDEGEFGLRRLQQLAPRQLGCAVRRGVEERIPEALTLRVLGFDQTTPTSDAEERQLLRAASRQGGGGNTIHYALCLMRAGGSTRDRRRAHDWLRSLQEHGDVTVRHRAALALADDLLVAGGRKSDAREGLALLRGLVDEGNQQAALRLVDGLLSGPVGREGTREGRRILRRLARGGQLEAIGRLLNGVATSRDQRWATDLLRAEAESGRPEARLILGNRLLGGHGLPMATIEGRALLEGLARQGDARAALCLSRHLAEADDTQRGSEAARSLLESMSDRGNAWATETLADWLLRGDVVKPDPNEGLRLLRLLADTGDLEANRQLVFWLPRVLPRARVESEVRWHMGMLADLGTEEDRLAWVGLLFEGSEADQATGRMLLEELVAEGSAQAWNTWIERLLEGSGLPRDPDLARAQIRLRAESGNRSARRKMAMESIAGGRLPTDPIEASYWLRVLAQEGDAWAIRMRAQWIIEGHLPSEGPEEVRLLLRTQAKSGRDRDVVRLAKHLIDGEGLAPEPEEGLSLLRACAEQGNWSAMEQLAKRLLDGDGVPVDVAEGLSWLTRLAEAGDSWGLLVLGCRLIQGEGMSADPLRGAEFLEQLAASGDDLFSRNAQWMLASHWMSGKNLPADPARARKMLERLVRRSRDARAKATLATRLLDGEGLTRDPGEGVRLLNEMILGGSSWARLELGIRFIDGRGVPVDLDAASGILGAFLKPGAVQSDQAKLLGVLRRVIGASDKIPPGLGLAEVCHASVDTLEDELLVEVALCCARGFGVPLDWDRAHKAVCAIREPIKISEAWSSDNHARDERDLVMGWLAIVHQVPDPDGLTAADRFDRVRPLGWDVPVSLRRQVRWRVR